MQISNIRMFSPNIICNCVNKYDDHGFSGELYHSYSKEPCKYKDLSRMLIMMEEFYDQIKFPMASTECRSFSKMKASPNRKEMMKLANDDSLLKKRGEKGTFIIQVQYRQNSTWQGKIVWVEENKTQYFRSALELIKIMDSALNPGETEETEATSEKEDKRYATS